MRKLLLPMFALAFVVAAPAGYAAYRGYHFRNFRVVQPGFLLRSGQLSPQGLHRVWHEFGVGTVVTLRVNDELKGNPDLKWEEKKCKKEEMVFVRLPPLPWHAKDDGPIPAQANVDRWLEVLRDAKKYPRPILVHCFKGTHRTGIYIALYRMEIERWSNEEAIAELMDQGYDLLEDEPDVHGYLRAYVPTWKRGKEPKAFREGPTAEIAAEEKF